MPVGSPVSVQYGQVILISSQLMCTLLASTKVVRKKPDKVTMTTGKTKSGVDITDNMNQMPVSGRFRGRIKISDSAII